VVWKIYLSIGGTEESKEVKKGRKGQTVFFPGGYWSAASPGWKSEVSVTGTFQL